MRGKIARIALVLVLIFACLATMAASCDPDPGGWEPTQGSPMDGVYATETFGAEQWYAQLTAIEADK